MYNRYYILTLLICGCANINTHPVVEDILFHSNTVNICLDRFDQEDSEDIKTSISKWNNVFDKTKAPILIVNQGICYYTIHNIQFKNVCNTNNSLGCVDVIGGHNIYINRHMINNQFKLRGVILHEVGHLLGAHHTTTGLMKPEYSDKEYSFIDQKTISEVARFWTPSHSQVSPPTLNENLK